MKNNCKTFFSLILVTLFLLTACNSGSNNNSPPRPFIPPQLAFNKQEKPIINMQVNESKVVSLEYFPSNSIFPESAIYVSLNLKGANIVSFNPSYCMFTQSNNSCLITLQGLKSGNVQLNAQSTNFDAFIMSTTLNINVTNNSF
ncbi:MAG TPA: hypothetical protein PKD00_08880 [Burkholderiales bacterium]|nr:hypothetical protein [Burkholderiales bacterium]